MQDAINRIAIAFTVLWFLAMCLLGMLYQPLLRPLLFWLLPECAP